MEHALNSDTLLSSLSDPQRMLVLASIDLDNPELRLELDLIAERTAERLGLPVGLITVVLDSAQLFAGSHGVAGWMAQCEGTPVEWSFCAQTVASGQPYIVQDATIDPLQKDNPLVTIDGMRCYAGVPVVIDGQVLGAHCVAGPAAHVFTESELTELRHAAQEVTTLIERYRITW